MKKIIFISILFTLGCSNDDPTSPVVVCLDPSNPDCENYDPCWGKSPTQASFRMLSQLDLNDTFFIEFDTVLAGRIIKFQALNDGYNKYEWQIGFESERRKGKEVLVEFGAAYGTLPITLFVSNNSPSDCFPEDKGFDTLQKFIFVLDSDNAQTLLGIFGRYKGVNFDDPDNKYEISVNPYRIDGGTYRPASIIGLKKTCQVNGGILQNIIVNPHSLKIPIGFNDCGDIGTEGYGKLSKNHDTLTIEYTSTYFNSGETFVEKNKFIGIKI